MTLRIIDALLVLSMIICVIMCAYIGMSRDLCERDLTLAEHVTMELECER